MFPVFVEKKQEVGGLQYEDTEATEILPEKPCLHGGPRWPHRAAAGPPPAAGMAVGRGLRDFSVASETTHAWFPW